jgi:hypothetical protein
LEADANKHVRSEDGTWRGHASLNVQNNTQSILSGYLTVSAAYHPQGQVSCLLFSISYDNPIIYKTKQTYLTPSTSIHSKAVQDAINVTARAEALMNAVILLTHKAQYHASISTLEKIKSSTQHQGIKKYLGQFWPSICSGLTWVNNRITPPHRDKNGFYEGFDYLSYSGLSRAKLDLRDLGMTLSCDPGCVVALAGRLLTHQVDEWESGDRICIARFIRRDVMTNLGIETLELPALRDVKESLCL